MNMKRLFLMIAVFLPQSCFGVNFGNILGGLAQANQAAMQGTAQLTQVAAAGMGPGMALATTANGLQQAALLKKQQAMAQVTFMNEKTAALSKLKQGHMKAAMEASPEDRAVVRRGHMQEVIEFERGKAKELVQQNYDFSVQIALATNAPIPPMPPLLTQAMAAGPAGGTSAAVKKKKKEIPITPEEYGKRNERFAEKSGELLDFLDEFLSDAPSDKKRYKKKKKSFSRAMGNFLRFLDKKIERDNLEEAVDEYAEKKKAFLGSRGRLLLFADVQFKCYKKKRKGRKGGISRSYAKKVAEWDYAELQEVFSSGTSELIDFAAVQMEEGASDNGAGEEEDDEYGYGEEQEEPAESVDDQAMTDEGEESEEAPPEEPEEPAEPEEPEEPAEQEEFEEEE